MEAILGIALIWGCFYVLGLLMNAGGKTVRAAAKSVVGKGTFSDNINLEFKGMGAFQVRLVDIRLGVGGDGPLAKAIEAKGIFPLVRETNVGFVTSVFDDTSGEYKVIISALEMFQESESIVYQNQIEVGKVEPNQGYLNWARVGIVIPEILQPPFSGIRNLDIIIRMIDMDNPPKITHGFGGQEKHPGFLWLETLSFSHDFSEKGYEEAAEHRDEAMAISVKVGIAVAMADGFLDDCEGETLKKWIIRNIEPFTEEKKQRLKTLYNTAMKDAYADAVSGDLSLRSLINRLNEIAEKSIKYETIELCFDVMAADGVADAEEMKIIRKVAEALELDLEEIEKMRDLKIVGLDTNATDHASIEDLLGIESYWDKEQIKKHLRAEFQKWNQRLNTLSEGEERENAQRMIDLIANARKGYV